MNQVVEIIFIFSVTYLLVYGIYYILILRKEEKVKKLMTSTESKYLKQVYKINFGQFEKKWLARKIIATNSLIISVTAMIAYLAPNIILMLLLGFLILFPTILISYYFLGKFLQKKSKKK